MTGPLVENHVYLCSHSRALWTRPARRAGHQAALTTFMLASGGERAPFTRQQEVPCPLRHLTTVDIWQRLWDFVMQFRTQGCESEKL